MDLPAEAQRLRLDALAVALSAALHEADLPHALIKGPSTATWLYRPPRPYRDVDLLVPRSRLAEVVAWLAGAGLAHPAAGRVGEEAEHSLLLRSAEGFEVDLHVSLPGLPPAGDLPWTVLQEHRVQLVLDVGTVPTLDEAGRCLVLALHALTNARSPQAREDLLRARASAAPGSWEVAAALARELGAGDLFAAGLAVVESSTAAPGSPRARLFAAGAPSAALGLQRLAEAPWRRRPLLLWRELVPSRGFLRAAEGERFTPPLPMTRALLRRWWRLARALPAATAAWRAARRPGAGR